jgi:hypothetical protein
MQNHVASAMPRRASAATGARDAAGAAARTEPRASGENAAQAGRDRASESERQSGAERLFSDLYDRPEDPTGMADLGLDRPLKELVAEICADFGVDGGIRAERLGLDEAAMAAPVPAGGKRRSGGGRRRADRDDRHRARPPGTMPKAAMPGAPPHTAPPNATPPNATPSAPIAADHQNQHPSDSPMTGDPGRIAEIGLGGRNRRERRAALKLARRSSTPPPSANRRQPESGRGPP